MEVLKKVIQYNDARPMLLTQLHVMGLLEEMSKLEMDQYQENPTSLNALLVPLKTEIRLKKCGLIEFEERNEVGKIFFESGESFDDMTILKADGIASRLTLE